MSNKIGDLRNNPITNIREIYTGTEWVPDTSDVALKINQKKPPHQGPKERSEQIPKTEPRPATPPSPRPSVSPPPKPPKPEKPSYGYLKYLVLLLVLVMVGVAAFSFLPTLLSSSSVAPLGTAENPYLISNGDDLRNIICGDDTVHYALANDIDVSSYGNWEPIVQRDTFLLWTDLLYFQGTLDGRGHKITGLKCTDDRYAGLFWENHGTIKNLVVENAYITADDAYSAGVLVASNFGTISNCQVSGTVTGSASSMGGLVGSNGKNCLISGSSFSGTVSGKANNMGGIAGGNSGEIVDTSFKGTVNSDGGSEFNFAAGGIAGTVYGTVKDSSASGQISGVGHVGGIAGTIDGGKVINCKSSGSVDADLVTRSGSQKYAMAGGIAGLVKGYSGSTGTVQGCTSSASVSAEKISGFTMSTYISETGRIAAYISDYGQVL